MADRTMTAGLVLLVLLSLSGQPSWAAEFLDLDSHDQATLARCLQAESLKGGATHQVEGGDTLSYIINGGPPGKDYPRNYVPRADFHNFQQAVGVVEDLVSDYHNAMNAELSSASVDIQDVDRIFEGNQIYLPSGDELIRIVNGEASRAVVRDKLENPDAALRSVVPADDLEKWKDAQNQPEPAADPVASSGDGQSLLGVRFQDDRSEPAAGEAPLPEGDTLADGLADVLTSIRAAIAELDFGGDPDAPDGEPGGEVDPDYYIESK